MTVLVSEDSPAVPPVAPVPKATMRHSAPPPPPSLSEAPAVAAPPAEVPNRDVLEVDAESAPAPAEVEEIVE